MANFGSLVVALNANIAGFAQGMNKAQGMLASFSSSMATLGTGLVLGGGAFAIGSAVKDYADFEDAALRVKATTKATADEMQLLTSRVHELAKQSGVDQNSIWGIMLELGRANFQPEEINSVAEAVTNLAKGTGSDAGLSGQFLSEMINNFQMSASEAVSTADKIAVAANASQVSVEDLGEALKYIGNTGADIGVTSDEVLTMAGVLGNLGTRGTMAGTAIRRLFLDMSARADEMERIFGRSFLTVDRQFIGAAASIKLLSEATAGMTAPERLQKFEEAFGVLGVTAASSLAKMVGMFDELRSEIENSSGESARLAAEMESGVGGSIRKLSATWTEFKMTFISEWADAISAALQMATGWVAELRDWWNWLQHIYAAGFLTLGVTWGWLWDNMGSIAIGTLSEIALWGLMAFDTLYNSLKWLKDATFVFAQNFASVMITAAKNTHSNFKTMFYNIKEIFKATWAFIKSGGTAGFEPAFKPFKSLLSDLVTKELPKFENKFSKVTESLQQKVGSLASKVRNDFSQRLNDSLATLREMQGEVDPQKPEWDPTKTPMDRSGGGNGEGDPGIASELAEAIAKNQSALPTAQLGLQGTAKAYDIIMKARDGKMLRFLEQIARNTAKDEVPVRPGFTGEIAEGLFSF